MTATRLQKAGYSVYAAGLLLVFYFPVLCIVIASLSKRRYFSFPYETKFMTTKWYEKAIESPQVMDFLTVSLKIASLTAVISVVIGFFSALAYARFRWKGRKLFQRIVLLPLFFPQSVLGLALLMWFSFLEITPSWHTAVVAHTIWITPITTLIIAIQAYGLDESLEEAAKDMGATRLQVLSKITFPLLLPGVISAALFAVLLSWGNFALSLFTTGADSSLPEWLYAKMTSGYQPFIPAIGVLSVIIAIAFVILIFGLIHFMNRKTRPLTPAH